MHSFQTQDVTAIGLKRDRSLGLSSAKLFGMSLMTACFHCWGSYQWTSIRRLKMCRCGATTAGHSLSTR